MHKQNSATETEKTSEKESASSEAENKNDEDKNGETTKDEKNTNSSENEGDKDSKNSSNEDKDTSTGDKPDKSTTKPEDSTTQEPKSTRIVAVGDVHGDVKATRAVLRLAGIIDDKDQWVGGTTTLVQTGDVLDRGDDEPEIMDLLDRLVPQAKKAGGRVVLLLGNHELMNALGDLRYVTDDGFRDYAKTPLPDKIDPKVASKPASWQHRWAAFAPGYAGGKRLAKRQVVAKVGDSVFLHGGLVPKYAKLGIDTINQQAQSWLNNGGPAPAWVTDSSGPVWSRHYSQGPDAMDCKLLRSALQTLGAKRMVVGHTVHIKGIESACDGQIWTIDVGMSRYYGGQPSALEIVNDKVKVMRFDPRRFEKMRRRAK